MPLVEFEVAEFQPLAPLDLVEVCHDGIASGIADDGQTEYSYKQCQNFSSQMPQPKFFHASTPCRITAYAQSIFGSAPDQQQPWSWMNPSAYRLKMSYIAILKRRLKNQEFAIENFAQLPKFEVQASDVQPQLAPTSPFIHVSIRNNDDVDTDILCSLNRNYYDYLPFSS